MTLTKTMKTVLGASVAMLAVGVLGAQSSVDAQPANDPPRSPEASTDRQDRARERCRSERRFNEALDDLTADLTAIRQGDAEPYIAEWSTADDVTLFGAWGPIEQGHAQLADTFRWVASRFGPEGETIQDFQTIHRSDDLAVTIGFERGPARVDGGPIIEMVIRVTHVLRCEQGEWKLVHRHADFPTTDPRQP